MLLASPEVGPDQVLILAPFDVPTNVQFCTKTPVEPLSSFHLPRLPTLVQKTAQKFYKKIQLPPTIIRLVGTKITSFFFGFVVHVLINHKIDYEIVSY